MKFLVTGAAGFIGSNLVQRLAEVGEVRGLDDLSTGYLRNIEGLNLDFIEAFVQRSKTHKTLYSRIEVTGVANILETKHQYRNPKKRCIQYIFF